MAFEEKSRWLADRARQAFDRAKTERRIDHEPIDPKLVHRMAAALRRLPERQRAIFLAVRHDRATYAELASRYGISIADVEREFARALVALADAADG